MYRRLLTGCSAGVPAPRIPICPHQVALRMWVRRDLKQSRARIHSAFSPHRPAYSGIARSSHEISSSFCFSRRSCLHRCQRTFAAPPDPLPWSQRAANAAIARWPDGRFAPAGAPSSWNYELGTLLAGMRSVWLTNVDPRDFNYIKAPSISPRRSRRLHPHAQARRASARQHPPRPPASLPLRRHAGQALPHRRHLPLEPARRTAAQRRRRLLAQAALSQPDVARRPLHGRALPRRIRLHLPSPRGIRRHHQAVRAHGAARPRSQNRPALPRLGRSRSRSAGPTSKPATRKNSGRAASAGT